MPRFLVTVITINRNHSSGLQRTIRSFRNLRGEADVQFVLIDGASTDHSLEIGKSFYKPEEIYSEPDDGIYDAMNKGLAKALGTYVIWINSGDEWLHQGWQLAKTALLSSAPALLACGHEQPAQADGQPRIVHFSKPEDLPHTQFCHQALFFQRSTILLHGAYSLQYKIVSDRALTLKLLLAGETIEYCRAVIARVEPGGISANAYQRELENYQLDLDLGLLSFSGYCAGVARLHFFHTITYPIWRIVKSTASITGLSSFSRPPWLTRLAGAPDRAAMAKR